MTERLKIALQRVKRHAVSLGALSQKISIMDTLSTGDHFLTADEDIKGVGELLHMTLCFLSYRVLGIRHGVERTDRQRELVQDIEVGVVLLLHKAAQLLLHRSAIAQPPNTCLPEITHGVHIKSGIDEELHTLSVGEDQGLLGVDQRGEGMLSLHQT